MADRSDRSLLEREAEFWDRQEEELERLYERPHDWRFVPDLAQRISQPHLDFIEGAVMSRRGEIRSLLDVGCGNGWFCHFAAEAGIRGVGIDLSPRKIAAAESVARTKGVDHLCRFLAGDVMELELDEKVDLLTAQGSLHHFPRLETVLPRMVERFLRPGGYMLFSEPHNPGMAWRMWTLLRDTARSRLGRRFFDVEFFMEVNGAAPAAAEGAGAPQSDYNLRGESPAGVALAAEEPDMRKILTSRYELVDELYFNCVSGHLTNAFYVFMKPRWVRALWRGMLPLTVRLDTWLCRRPRFARHAEQGVWLLRRQAGSTRSSTSGAFFELSQEGEA